MADFVIYWPKYKQAEGGYQNHPNDSGNYNANGDLVGTNMGITPDTLQSYLGYVPGALDMQQIDEALAMQIIQDRYWNKLKADQIGSQYVANIIVDHYVNTGRVKPIQALLNTMGESLTVDGIIGPKTLAAINRQDPAVLHDSFRKVREAYYRDLADSNPSKYGVFLTGWLNRLDLFPWKTLHGSGAVNTDYYAVVAKSNKKKTTGRRLC